MNEGDQPHADEQHPPMVGFRDAVVRQEHQQAAEDQYRRHGRPEADAVRRHAARGHAQLALDDGEEGHGVGPLQVFKFSSFQVAS